MNIIRPEENALLIWNLNQARTAYISGEELKVLEQWASGKNSGFVDRLKKHGIIKDEDIQSAKKALALSKDKKAPAHSFCAPESLHVELTGHCPLKCPQCYKGQGQPKFICMDFFLSIIQQAGDMQVFQIALGGGEPLIYPGLHLVVKEISRCGMASSITTSGFGLDASTLDKLVRCGLNHIQISLNGSNEEVNSKSREGYEHAVRAIKLLSGYNISFGVNWVARRDNIDDFPNFIELMKAHNVGNVNILRYKPSPNEIYKDNCLTADKMTLLAGIIKNTRGIKLKVDSAYANLLCHINQRTSFMSGCGAGRRFLAIDSEGYFRPCSHVSMSEKCDNLFQAWYYSEHLGKFREVGKRVEKPCASCDYLHGCYGCRAVVLGRGGAFFDGDLECPYSTSKEACFCFLH